MPTYEEPGLCSRSLYEQVRSQRLSEAQLNVGALSMMYFETESNKFGYKVPVRIINLGRLASVDYGTELGVELLNEDLGHLITTSGHIKNGIWNRLVHTDKIQMLVAQIPHPSQNEMVESIIANGCFAKYGSLVDYELNEMVSTGVRELLTPQLDIRELQLT